MDNFYAHSKQDIFYELSTNDNGLTEDEAANRLNKYGYNEFREKKSRSTFQRFVDQFREALVLILMAASIISIAIGEITDAAIILSIVILNAFLGVIQESKAEQSLNALKKIASPTAHVIRDGESNEIPAREVVPGDIVILEAGKYIPGDLRLIDAVNLKIEESSLTGESIPVEKNNEPILSDGVPIGDRRNMAFMSSMVTYGRGKGVVTATGMNTEIGRIADMISSAENEKTPLQKKLADVGKTLGIAAIIICLFMFVVGIIQGREIFKMFMLSVSLAVAAIPEGLPAVVTIVLAVGVQKMIKKNAIIRKLPAVETLGSASVICSDKTGTLTQNKMTVTKIYTISGFMGNSAETEKLLITANLCNDSQIVNEGATIKLIGDPTETALVDAALKSGIDKRELERRYTRIDEIPFDSDRKLMTTINKFPNSITVNVKGAPDIMLSKCRYVLEGDSIREITGEDRLKIKDANESMGKNALRVLAIGFKEISSLDKSNAEEDLIFIGLTGMIDPPREEAKEAVKLCRAAGIKPVMITGDHKVTASAIARELGILNQEAEAISGAELEALSQDELENRVDALSVYARVSPEHKVRIVEAWKAKNKIVAMTGDGVNDAPALKTADIGAAMGITGTDVAKEAADMILTDDNFATIISAVEEGRTIYSNIRKSINFLLSCNIGEIITLFMATLLGLPEPLLPIHILWVNLVTDSLPALALGMEPPEKDVMNKPPRNAKEGLFANGLSLKIAFQGMIIGFVTLFSYFYGHYIIKDETIAKSMAFFTLSFSQLVHTYNIRYEKKSVLFNKMFSNQYLNKAFLLSALIQLVVLITPLTRSIFKVELLTLPQTLIVLLCSLAPLIIVETSKLFRKN